MCFATRDNEHFNELMVRTFPKLTRSITENSVKLMIRETVYAEIDQSDRHYTRTGLKTEEVGEEMTEMQLTLSRGAASVHIWHVVDVYHRRIRRYATTR